MSVQVAKRLITVDEYYRMAKAGILTENDRVELINGEIIQMAPIGSKHAAAVNRFSNLLKELLARKVIVSVQNPIKINELNEPEPDITILRNRDDFYEDDHPTADDVLIVIEISDTTIAYDREIKLPVYAKAGIPEFWLVNLHRQELEVHNSPSLDVYKKREIIKHGDKVKLPDLGIEIDAGLLLGPKK